MLLRWYYVRGFLSNEGVKKDWAHSHEIVILPLLTRLACERLLIDTELLLIVTSTADEIFECTDIDDLERP